MTLHKKHIIAMAIVALFGFNTAYADKPDHAGKNSGGHGQSQKSSAKSDNRGPQAKNKENGKQDAKRESRSFTPEQRGDSSKRGQPDERQYRNTRTNGDHERSPRDDRRGQDRDRSGHDDRNYRDGGRNDTNISINLGFNDRQRTYIHDYYRDEFRRGHCPPGLAKKHNGCMPPGQAKRWRKGYPLDRDIIYYDLPPAIIVELGAPPRGYRYVRVAADILMIAVGTGLVVDAVADLSDFM
jgi:hypothetical protein